MLRLAGMMLNTHMVHKPIPEVKRSTGTAQVFKRRKIISQLAKAINRLWTS
jgi:hypothetical protein